MVPKTFGSIDSVRQVGDDRHRHYAFQADRGRFTAFADGRLVHLQATLDYSVRGWFKPIIGPTLGAGCGKDPHTRPRLAIELATPITLTDNWHLASHAQIVRVEPASTLPQDHCDVSCCTRTSRRASSRQRGSGSSSTCPTSTRRWPRSTSGTGSSRGGGCWGGRFV